MSPAQPQQSALSLHMCLKLQPNLTCTVVGLGPAGPCHRRKKCSSSRLCTWWCLLQWPMAWLFSSFWDEGEQPRGGGGKGQRGRTEKWWPCMMHGSERRKQSEGQKDRGGRKTGELKMWGARTTCWVSCQPCKRKFILLKKYVKESLHANAQHTSG